MKSKKKYQLVGTNKNAFEQIGGVAQSVESAAGASAAGATDTVIKPPRAKHLQHPQLKWGW